MITLRHHVLTIVAVFLALAAGIVLGGGPLSDVGTTVTAASRDDTEPADDGGRAAYSERFVSALAPPVLAGRLADRSVAVTTADARFGVLGDATARAAETAAVVPLARAAAGAAAAAAVAAAGGGAGVAAVGGAGVAAVCVVAGVVRAAAAGQPGQLGGGERGQQLPVRSGEGVGQRAARRGGQPQRADPGEEFP